MTEQPIVWQEGVLFFKVVCRLGSVSADSSADADLKPDLKTSGGTVTIKASAPRIRYQEADGFWRGLNVGEQTYSVQKGTGELVDNSGTVGLWLLNCNSPKVDPQGFTYEARIAPTQGPSWVVTFLGAPNSGDTIDLIGIDPIVASPGVSTFEQRLSTLETGLVAGEGVTEIVTLTQAEYDALENKSDTTMYIIS